MLYKTMSSHLSLSEEKNVLLTFLCRAAKNLYNEALYAVRQAFIYDGTYLSYGENEKALQNSLNYRILNSNMAQGVVREVDEAMSAFFGLIRAKQAGRYHGPIHLPGYMRKDGYRAIEISFVRTIWRNGKLCLDLPRSNLVRHVSRYQEEIYKSAKRQGYAETMELENGQHLTFEVPKPIQDKVIKEVRIVPKFQARMFEIQYVYEWEAESRDREIIPGTSLAIDLGVNNLATCVDSDGSSFIIDGKVLKSRNQLYHKKMARLSSQNAKTPETLTRRQIALIMKRNDQVKYYMNKSARMIVDYVLKHKIAEIIIGNNEDFQSGGISKQSLPRRIKGQINQQFCALPLGQLRNRLEQLSNDYRIVFTLQEESYTSQASFYDEDEIPVFEKGTETKTGFQGRRVHRGLYITKTGMSVNADVNAAFNIMKKSKPNTSFEKIWSRGASTPLRLRVV